MMYSPRRLSFGWVIVLCALGLAAGDCLAREGVVITKDGREFSGEVVKDDVEGVTLLISGIEMFLKRDEVDQVRYPKTVQEQYVERKAELSEDDADAWYRLVSWLFEMQAYPTARRELDQFTERYPNDSRAQRPHSNP